jgi:hypothetical protein
LRSLGADKKSSTEAGAVDGGWEAEAVPDLFEGCVVGHLQRAPPPAPPSPSTYDVA